MDKADQKQIETLNGLDLKLDKIIKESGYNYPGMSLSGEKSKENLRENLMKSISSTTEAKSAGKEFNIFGHGVQAYLRMIR